MTNVDISFEYWNELSNQIIMISSLLAGFSIAIIANFMVSDANTRLSRNIMTSAILTASSFLIAVFAMTKIHMITTKGYPLKIEEGILTLPRVIGITGFMLGIISLVSMISLSGWTKSKKMGIFTSIVGVLTIILIVMVL